MIKILSVKSKLLYKDKIKLEINISINLKKHHLFFILEKQYFHISKGENLDFLLPPLLIIASKIGVNIDLNNFMVSNKLLKNLKKVNLLLMDWDSGYKKVDILNCRPISNSSISRKRKSGLSFSGGVDSLYTLYSENNNINNLITTIGFDIHYKDYELIKKIKRKFNSFATENHKEIIYINTNIRKITDTYVDWDMIFGSCLATIGLLLDQLIDTLYISSWVENIVFPHGSHPDLDKLFTNNNIHMLHYGAGIKRIDKIKTIERHSSSKIVLRVCWKNIGGHYNCGICEKCIRFLLEKKALDLSNDYGIFAHDILNNEKINTLYITDYNLSYYNNIKYELFKKGDPVLIHYGKIIERKIMDYGNLEKQDGAWKKRKNILFIDFNGVISYNPFWISLKMSNEDLFIRIENLLFHTNKDILIDWMRGKKTSENICKWLSEELNEDYTTIYNTLIKDCESIDISNSIIKILEQLKQYYIIVLMTDNMDCFDRWTISLNSKKFKVFDEIFNSCNHGIFKKEESGKVFINYIHKYEAEIGNCLLIDDSKNNCNVFSEVLGGNVYNVKGEESVLKILNKLKRGVNSKWSWQY